MAAPTNGGTEAPRRGRRGRGAKAFGQGQGVDPGFTPSFPRPMPKVGGGRGVAKATPPSPTSAVGSAVDTGLGAQLSSRVSSGAITQSQAQQTAQQRQTLEKAYGKNWRVKVFGDRGYAQRTRKALTANPDSASIAALNKKLMEGRKEALERAREKIA